MPRVFRVTAKEAQSRGLPPVEVAFDLEGTRLLASHGIFPGVIATFSGPPGGPLGGSIEAVNAGEGSGWLEELVRERWDRPGRGPLVIGEPAEVEIGGVPRAALSFCSGQSLAQTSQVAVIVPLGKTGFSILATFGVGGRQPDATAVMAQPDLAAVARTLTFLA